MSQCAPEATLKPIRLKFTPEIVVSNVLVAQVCWDTWPGSSKAPVAKCVVCAWNGARSVGGRAEPASIWPSFIVIGAVLAQKFWWRHCPISPFITESIFSVLRNRKNTNFMYIIAYIWNLSLVGLQLYNALDPKTRRNETRRAESGGGVLVRGQRAAYHQLEGLGREFSTPPSGGL